MFTTKNSCCRLLWSTPLGLSFRTRTSTLTQPRKDAICLSTYSDCLMHSSIIHHHVVPPSHRRSAIMDHCSCLLCAVLIRSSYFLFPSTLFDVVCPCGSLSSLSTPRCCVYMWLLVFPVHSLMLSVHVALGLPCPHLDVVCTCGSWSSRSMP